MLTVDKHQHSSLAPGDLVRHISIYTSCGIVISVELWSSASGEDEDVANVLWSDGTQTRELHTLLTIINKVHSV